MEWLNDDRKLFCNYKLLNNKGWLIIIKKYVEDYWKGEAEMILVGLISKLVIILTIIAGQLKS